MIFGKFFRIFVVPMFWWKIFFHDFLTIQISNFSDSLFTLEYLLFVCVRENSKPRLINFFRIIFPLLPLLPCLLFEALDWSRSDKSRTLESSALFSSFKNMKDLPANLQIFTWISRLSVHVSIDICTDEMCMHPLCAWALPLQSSSPVQFACLTFLTPSPLSLSLSFLPARRRLDFLTHSHRIDWLLPIANLFPPSSFLPF